MHSCSVAPCRAKELPFIASMGIYVAKASAIKDLLTQHFPSQHDFGSDIIPGAKDLGFHVQARPESFPCSQPTTNLDAMLSLCQFLVEN